MKNLLRTLLTALTVMLATANVTAQRYYAPDFSIGIRCGATVSEMAWSPSVRQAFTPGYTIGITARYTEEKIFGLIGEINLAQCGWAESFDETVDFSYKRQFTYVRVPIMTHIYFGSKKFRGFVNLGPEFGYMISDRTSSNFDYANVSSVVGYPSNRHTEQLAMEVSNRFDYGIVGGIGFEARIAEKHSAIIEGRFYYGLANTFPAKRTDTFGASRNMSIEITAAYLFRLK